MMPSKVLLLACILHALNLSSAEEFPKRTKEQNFNVQIINQATKEIISGYENKVVVVLLDKTDDQVISGNGVSDKGITEMVIRKQHEKGPWLLRVEPKVEAPFAGEMTIDQEDVRGETIIFALQSVEVYEDIAFLIANEKNNPMANHFCNITGKKVRTDENGMVFSDLLATEEKHRMVVYRDGGDPYIAEFHNQDLRDGFIVIKPPRRRISCIVDMRSFCEKDVAYQLFIHVDDGRNRKKYWQHSKNGTFVFYDLPSGECVIHKMIDLDASKTMDMRDICEKDTFSIRDIDEVVFFKAVEGQDAGP